MGRCVKEVIGENDEKGTEAAGAGAGQADGRST